MGCALAKAALQAGHQVIILSGPVRVRYPSGAKVIDVETTQQMLDAAVEHFPNCDGLIGAAAPCDYRPTVIANHKIKKNGESLVLQLIETPDIVATLGKNKRKDQWTVGFALETDDARFQAIGKLQRKLCDLVVINGVQAINSENNEIEIIDPTGAVIAAGAGTKQKLARQILQVIGQKLFKAKSTPSVKQSKRV